jgi:hypothetical protein
VTFTGAAILLRDKAAYRGTSFILLDDTGAPRRKQKATPRRKPACDLRKSRAGN